ncbi:MAG: hypothetical protein ABSC54_11695 [Smithellaceae bacterium]
MNTAEQEKGKKMPKLRLFWRKACHPPGRVIQSAQAVTPRAHEFWVKGAAKGDGWGGRHVLGEVAKMTTRS